MKYAFGLIFSLIIAMVFNSSLFSQEPILIKQCIIPSTTEHDSIRFGILVPSSYEDSSNKQYPVIYYLHGLRDEYTGSIAQKIAGYFKDQFKKEQLPESLIVFPDGGEGFWGNHSDGDPLLETEIIKYLIPYIDHSYNTNCKSRLIIGWSAGGVGALVFYTKYPELFRAAISLDASIVNWEEFKYYEGERPDIAKDSVYYYEYYNPNKYIIRNQESLRQKSDTSLFIVASFFIPMHQRILPDIEDHGIHVNYMELNCDHDFCCIFSGVSDKLNDFISRQLK